MWCWTVIFGAATLNTKLIIHLLLNMVVGVTWTRGNCTQNANNLNKIFDQVKSQVWRNRWFCLQNIPLAPLWLAGGQMLLDVEIWKCNYPINCEMWEKTSNWNVTMWFSLQGIITEDIQNRVFELSCSWASSAMLQPPSSPAQRCTWTVCGNCALVH